MVDDCEFFVFFDDDVDMQEIKLDEVVDNNLFNIEEIIEIMLDGGEMNEWESVILDDKGVVDNIDDEKLVLLGIDGVVLVDVLNFFILSEDESKLFFKEKFEVCFFLFVLFFGKFLCCVFYYGWRLLFLSYFYIGLVIIVIKLGVKN